MDDENTKVRHIFKNAEEIENLDYQHWLDNLEILQSLSMVLQKRAVRTNDNQGVPGYILDRNKIAQIIPVSKIII